MADAEEQESVDTTPANHVVAKKYKMAGEMVNNVLKELIEKVKPGASVSELCDYGNQRLLEETDKVFKKDKKMKKGIAFPTCLSINNCICHYCPLKSEPDITINDEDMVKIDLGAHLDGFIAVAAHTIIVGATKETPVSGRKADVMMAAHKAMEAALRLVKPGNKNDAVTSGIQKITEDFNCKPIQGMLSHQLKQHIIDGEKAFIQNPTEPQKREHDSCEFDVNEVYGIDILVSTGDGKGRELDTRTTVYKKRDFMYQLKMRTSRHFMGEVDKRYGLMPFSLRLFEEENKAKLGVVECVKHNLLQPFNVLYEKEGEFVAQFKQTVILKPEGPVKVTGIPIDTWAYKTELSVKDPESLDLLRLSISKKTTKKKKKEASKDMAETLEDGEEDGEEAAAPQTESLDQDMQGMSISKKTNRRKKKDPSKDTAEGGKQAAAPQT